MDMSRSDDSPSARFRPNGRLIAILAGPLAGAAVGFGLQVGSTAGSAAAAIAATTVWMAIWWMTEAIPLAATALLPIVLVPLIDLSQVPFRKGDRVGVTVEDQTRLARIVAVEPHSTSTSERTAATSGPTYQIRWEATEESADPAVLTVTADQIQPWGATRSPLARAVTPYADKFIFLFLGGFIVARGIERWRLHRRVALHVLEVVGTSPARLVGGAMLVTAAMSMWLSNTATTLVMLPVALSLTEPLAGSLPTGSSAAESRQSGFRTAMLLGIAYAATWGGLMTPIGTPPNALLMREMSAVGRSVSFAEWIAFAAPLSLMMLAFTWWLLVGWAFKVPRTPTVGAAETLAASRRALGRLTRGEAVAGSIFLMVAGAWVLREPIATAGQGIDGMIGTVATWVGRWDDATVAIAGALAMFVVPVGIRPWRPVIDWEEAKGLPWDVLLLFGGGLCLSDAIRDSGLDLWIGAQLDGLGGVPLWLLILVIALIVTLLTEMTSNMATAALFLPLVASLGERLRPMGASPELLMVPAALAASCAFMLPVATPPNALVFAGGDLKIKDMVRVGLVLNLASKLAITAWVMLVGRWWLGL